MSIAAGQRTRLVLRVMGIEGHSTDKARAEGGRFALPFRAGSAYHRNSFPRYEVPSMIGTLSIKKWPERDCRAIP